MSGLGLGLGLVVRVRARVRVVALPPSCAMKLRATRSSEVHEETDHHVTTCQRGVARGVSPGAGGAECAGRSGRCGVHEAAVATLAEPYP